MNVEAFSTKKGANVALTFLQKHDAITAIDESSTIKNLRAKRTKNILKLRQWSPYRRILTGTPVTKSPIDLYSQCDFLDPKHLGFATFTAFKNRYCIFKSYIPMEINKLTYQLDSRTLKSLKQK